MLVRYNSGILILEAISKLIVCREGDKTVSKLFRGINISRFSVLPAITY